MPATKKAKEKLEKKCRSGKLEKYKDKMANVNF